MMVDEDLRYYLLRLETECELALAATNGFVMRAHLVMACSYGSRVARQILPGGAVVDDGFDQTALERQ